MLITMRHPGRRAVTIDVALAAAVLAASVSGNTDRLARWLPLAAQITLAVVQSVVVIARRRAPFPVLAVTTGIGVVMTAAGLPTGTSDAGTLVAAYAVGSRGQEQPDSQ